MRRHIEQLKLFQSGLELQQSGSHEEAVLAYENALAINSNFPECLNNLGVALRASGRLIESLESFERATHFRPSFADAINNRGIVLRQLNRTLEALAAYDQCLAINPEFSEAWNNKANILKEQGKVDEALTCYDRVIDLRPEYAEAHNNKANALQILGRNDEALDCYGRAISLKPEYADAHYNCGTLLLALKRFDEAQISLSKAIELRPNYAEAHNNLGTALHELKRHAEAIAAYDQALRHKPDFADAYYNRGNALHHLRRLEEALDDYDHVVRLKPDFTDALNNRGIALKQLKRVAEALQSYEQAIKIRPDYAESFNNKGNALKELRHLEAALASYEEAIRLQPDHAEAFNNRAIVLKDLRRLEQAAQSYEQALKIDPDFKFLLGAATHAHCVLCQWDGLPERLQQITAGIARDKPVSPTFPLLSLIDDPALHKKAAQIWTQQMVPASGTLGTIPRRTKGKKIHLAYLSADFHDHATAYLMAELFELHDRQKFELTAISFGPDRPGPVRTRLMAAFDRFVDVRGLSDLKVAAYCREIGVDIAVDLKGYTHENRAQILAERCAPLQINWIGYPGTMGAPFIDYVIADRIVIPPERHDDYIEKIIWLDGSYQVNDRKRSISEKVYTRAECAIPEDAFVFCCFNNNYKILPTTFDVWMRILHKVPRSVLWLFEDNKAASANLRKEAASRGIDPQRLVFASRIPLAEHLARHRIADLFLDTWPYNAHTTASDALWAGLPVLTLPGKSFASRVAASLLHAIGLPEMVTSSEKEYEDFAIALANDPARLLELKTKLQTNRLTQPLFDCARFTRGLEDAYTKVMDRYWQGGSPDHLLVTPQETSTSSSEQPSIEAASMSPKQTATVPLPSAQAVASSATSPRSLAAIMGLTARLEVMDIGAACITEVPIYRTLLDRGLAHLHAFEGDARQIEKIEQTYQDRVTIHRSFLFDGTEQTVYLTSQASGMTSLLCPRPSALRFFNGFAAFGKVLDQAAVQTMKLDDVPGLADIDFLKMDIQGAELTVLKNGSKALEHCLAIQLEVSFVELYENQPSFGEVDIWMRSRGYVPHRFLDVKRWSIAPTVRNNNIRAPFNQLLEADIIYIRDPLNLAAWTDEQLRKLALLAHECFESPDLAMHLILELDRRRPTVGSPSLSDQYLALLSRAAQ